jgi:hypothetical protein
MTVIGSNISGGSGGADVIAIGTNAGSNLPALSNNIYIGSNAGYRPTTANTLVVQSLVSTAPTLQADLANRWLGIGKVPTTALDVQGSVLLTGGTVTLSTAIVTTNLTVCGTTTLSGQVMIANLSAMNTIVPAGGRLSVSGATTLSGVTLNVLNGVSWPATTGSANQQLVMNQAGTAAVWAAPGVADAALWSCNNAVRTVNMAGFGLTGLSSINGLITTICSVTNQIGIGANLLTNNTAMYVVAFGNGAGSNAAANSTWSNCVYLGAQPAAGTPANGSDTFLLYSTTAGVPALQVNMANRQLGVGMVPSNALDVTGAARISSTLTSIGNVTIGTIPSPSNYSLNINGATTTGMIAFYNTATTPRPQFGIGFDKAAGGLAIKANSGGEDFTGTAMFMKPDGRIGLGMIDPAHLLDVAGQINATTAVSTPSLAVSTSTSLTGTLTLRSIASVSYTTLNRVLSYNSTTGAVTQSTLNLGTLGAADSNTMNANWVTSGGGTITWNATTRVVSGTARLLAIPVNNALSTDGALTIANNLWTITMLEYSATYWVPNSVPTSSTVAGSFKNVEYRDIADQVTSNWVFICETNADYGTLKWGPGFITIPSGGVYNSQTGGMSWNVLATATNIALGSNSSITGTRSIVIGSNAASGVAASNVIAIGTNAGSNLPTLSNNIYIGSNAGYNPTTANTLVVQSTSATAPTLQADLANRRLGVGMVPSNALDVSGTIRSSGPVISTLNVAGITSGTSITLTTDNATTYYSLTTTTGTTLTLTLPATPPPQGTYWVLKNNAAVNYTFTTTSTNGVFNAGSNSYYLQAGIGITLAYSGTLVNGFPAYYTL